MMMVSGVWSLPGYLEHTHGHAHPGHWHQVALHPLLARPQASALIDQQAVVLLLLVIRGKQLVCEEETVVLRGSEGQRVDTYE